MYFRYLLSLLMILFFFNGCSSKGGPGSLLSYTSTISTEEVNQAFAKVFPRKKKSSLGRVMLKNAILKPSSKSDKVVLSVAFELTSFEIPEGIDGTLGLSAGLRYDPKSKKIYLKEVTPINMKFSNRSLEAYVSKGARSALNIIAMRELTDIEIYQVEESFSARFIKNIVVDKGHIVIRYGL